MNDLPEGFEVESGGGAGANGLPPGFEVDQSAQAKPSLLAPVSVVGELGARGINWAAQNVVNPLLGTNVPNRAPQPMQPFGAGSWQPSMGPLVDTVKSGVTLPGDVYAGKVDPLSEEGMRRAYNLASITPLSTLPTVGARAAEAALPTATIEGMASASYNAIRREARDIPLAKPPPPPDYMAPMTGPGKYTLNKLSSEAPNAMYPSVWEVADRFGNPVARINGKIDGDKFLLENIYAGARNPSRAAMVSEEELAKTLSNTRNTLGPRAIRDILEQFQQEYPDVKTIIADRVSGARYGGGYDTAAIGQEVTIPLRKRALPTKETADSGPTAASIADNVGKFIESRRGPREAVAGDAWDKIKDIAKAKDVGDLVDSYKLLAKMATWGKGENRAAAQLATEGLDSYINGFLPGATQELRIANKDYAISRRAAEYEQRIKNASIKAANRGMGGNEGNLLRQAVEPLTLKGAQNVSPAVRAAAENVTQPGWWMQGLRAASGLDPTSSKLMAAITLNGMNPITLPTAALGAGSRMLYDRILRNRAQGVLNAIRAESPASLEMGYPRVGGVISMPGAVGANTGILAPMQSGYPLRLTVRPSDAL